MTDLTAPPTTVMHQTMVSIFRGGYGPAYRPVVFATTIGEGMFAAENQRRGVCVNLEGSSSVALFLGAETARALARELVHVADVIAPSGRERSGLGWPE